MKPVEIYGNRIIFPNIVIPLWQGSKLEHDRISFPFCFELPSNVNYPPNFKCHQGCIRYQLTAYVERCDTRIVKTLIPLNISPFLPVSLPMYNVPQIKYEERSLICCSFLFGMKGSAKISLYYPKSAVCRGNCFRFSLNVENHSEAIITGFTTGLYRRITLRGNQQKKESLIKTKEQTMIIDTTFTCCNIPARASIKEDIEIPIELDLTPTFSSHLFDLDYYLEVRIDTQNWCRSSINIPIVVGTADNSNELIPDQYISYHAPTISSLSELMLPKSKAISEPFR